MKQKKAGLVIIAGLLLFNLHFQHGLAEGNQQQWYHLPVEPLPGAWVSGQPVEFHADSYYQRNQFLKASQTLADTEESAPEERAGKAGMRGPTQLIGQIPQLRSVLAVKDGIMNKVAPVLENPDGRLFVPMFNSENQNRMPRQELSSPENLARSASENKESGRSGQAQERYFVGYRLSSRANQLNENWYLGVGWKSGGGRGRRDGAGKDGVDAGTPRTNTLSDNKDQGQNAVKVEYSGPIVGIVGQF